MQDMVIEILSFQDKVIEILSFRHKRTYFTPTNLSCNECTKRVLPKINFISIFRKCL